MNFQSQSNKSVRQPKRVRSGHAVCCLGLATGKRPLSYNYGWLTMCQGIALCNGAMHNHWYVKGPEACLERELGVVLLLSPRNWEVLSSIFIVGLPIFLHSLFLLFPSMSMYPSVHQKRVHGMTISRLIEVEVFVLRMDRWRSLKSRAT